jgi:outer membrane receptor protein involved in Fe transport
MTLTTFAQTAGVTPTAPTVEGVVITGSRINTVSADASANPISVVTAENMALTKATNLEDVLARIPFVTLDVFLGSNNGGTGASNAGLHDLGASRTLILIDGQRLIPAFSPTSSVPNLNVVPLSMVDRIEVLRDGASSIYGADAIGGVINIITRKHVDGASFDAAYGKPTDSGGETRSLSGSMGLNSTKVNATVAVSWDHLDPVEQNARSWAVDPHQGASYGAGGSTYRSELNVLQDEFSNSIWIGGKPYSVSDPATSGLVPNTVYLGAPVNALKLNAGAPGWNYLTLGLDRKQINLNTHYDVAPSIRIVLEGFFTDNNAEASLRPEPLLGDTIATTAFAGFYVPDYAPGNTTGRTITALLTPDQFGPRRTDTESQTSRVRIGLEGTVGRGEFHWQAGFVDQHNRTVEVTHHEGNFNHLAQLTGQINCIDAPGGCVSASPAQLASSATQVATGTQSALVTSVPAAMPDFFNGPNMFSAAQVAYLTWDNTEISTASERYSYATIDGPVLKLPAGAARAAIGVEHRDEAASDAPDALVQEGWGPNQAEPTSGGYGVSSVYAELNVPILKDSTLARSLTLAPSGRIDKYDSFGTARTWRMGLAWTPLGTVSLRSAYSTGFRAPGVAESFAGQQVGDFTASGDPCDTRSAGYNGNANVGRGILAAGSTCSKAVANGAAVTNFQSGNNNQTAQQLPVLIGGNPRLKPETSAQFGFGVVLTPSLVPGLTLSADYYDIRIDNTVLTGGVVSATSVDTVLLGCYGSPQNQAFCSLITRSPVNGTITRVSSVNANFGEARVSGVDYELSYDTARALSTLPMPGSVEFDLQAQTQLQSTQSNADGSLNSYVGHFQYENETIHPRWSALATIEYTLGRWKLHWDTRFYEHMTNFDGGPGISGNEIPNTFYHSISGSYTLKGGNVFRETRFVLGVGNLLDKAPPFLTGDSSCKCNSMAGTFDAVGRVVYGRISAKF